MALCRVDGSELQKEYKMDWDKLRIFHAVADAGSLTHAGDALHLSQSAVSRQVRALEESLNTVLKQEARQSAQRCTRVLCALYFMEWLRSRRPAV